MEARAAFHEHLLQWVLRAGRGAPPGFLIGINGPQGAGKSTLCAALCERLAALGKSAIAVSIDDFYLTHEEQARLAALHPANPYLQQRGYPGTHDLALGEKVLSALASQEPGRLQLPRYNKAACGGAGDRFPAQDWPEVALPVDFVLLEGWMLGFPPVARETLPDPALREVNELLAGYSAWTGRLHAFLQLDPVDYHFVLDWRVEAEQKMRAQGRGGMSDEEIQAYVRKFLPAYEVYLPALRAQPPVREHFLRVVIGKNRLVSDPFGEGGAAK